MHRTLVAAVLFLLLSVTAFAAEPEGTWIGMLNAGAQQLRISVEITRDANGRLSATVTSIDQGNVKLPVSEVTFSGDTLRLKLSALNAGYEGKLAGSAITGSWQQGGVSLPLVLRKGEVLAAPPEPARPQTPKKPYPYDEQEVSLVNGDIRLGGTLTLPRGTAPFPVVLLLTGSGAQDRDETLFSHKPFLVIADHLTRRGVAVLRMDDRGVGKSTGKIGEATLDEMGTDALAAIDFLKKRKELDPKRIGLIGHSEGGLIATMVASKSPDVAYVALLASPGIPGDELVNLQSKVLLEAMGVTSPQLDVVGSFQRKVIALAKSTPTADELRTKLRELVATEKANAQPDVKAIYEMVEQNLDAEIPLLASRSYRAFLSYDPRPAMRKVTVPVLALNGSKDLQVPPKENLGMIQATMPKATIVEVPGVNHLFQTAATGAPSEYADIIETFSPVALMRLGDWITAVSKPKQ